MRPALDHPVQHLQTHLSQTRMFTLTLDAHKFPQRVEEGCVAHVFVWMSVLNSLLGQLYPSRSLHVPIRPVSNPRQMDQRTARSLKTAWPTTILPSSAALIRG